MSKPLGYYLSNESDAEFVSTLERSIGGLSTEDKLNLIQWLSLDIREGPECYVSSLVELRTREAREG